MICVTITTFNSTHRCNAQFNTQMQCTIQHTDVMHKYPKCRPIWFWSSQFVGYPHHAWIPEFNLSAESRDTPWVLTNRAALADTKSVTLADTRCCLSRIHLTQFDLEGSGDGSVTSPWCSRIPSGLGDGSDTSPWPVRHQLPTRNYDMHDTHMQMQQFI